jgi:hypothetical protein
MKALILIIVLGSSIAFAQPPAKSKRTLKQFMVIQSERLTVSQILNRFGKPDRDIGSGIYIYEYDLSDGRKIRIHTPDEKVLMAATCYNPKTKRAELIYK